LAEKGKTMKNLGTCFLLLLLAGGFAERSVAQQDSADAARRKAEQAAAELQQKADQANGTACAKLSLRAARQAMDDADRLYLGGNMQAAHDAVGVSVRYARRAVECTLESRKYQKRAEIELRGLIRRMNELVRTLDSEERPQLTHAIAELEQERDRLLQAIFGAQAARPREQER